MAGSLARARITIGAATGTITVTRRLVQARTPPATVSLIQDLAQQQPRPTAPQVQEQLAARGIAVRTRTIHRYAQVAPAKRGRPYKRSATRFS